MANIYYLMVSVGPECRHSLAGCLWFKVSHEVVIKPPPGTVVSSEGLLRWGEEMYFQAHSCSGWQASYPCHMDPSKECPVAWWLASPSTGDPREAEKQQSWQKLQFFVFFLNNLISEVTSHCFCHIQFIRIKLQSEVDAQAEGTAHAGISGGHLRSFHHGYSLTWNLKLESNLLTENTGK